MTLFFGCILMRVNAAAIFPHNISIAPGVEMPLIGQLYVVFCCPAGIHLLGLGTKICND